MNAKATARRVAQSTAHSVLTWEWTKQLLHWLIISAGTMSECVFLVASLWMSVNSSVHTFVLSIISAQMDARISDLATTAYVALPELILGLAFVTTISHVRTWLYNKHDKTALIWSILYGLPTIVFLVLSLVTLGSSVASSDFQLPQYLVVIRALAGYMFAFTSLLHAQLGIPQEADRLQRKDESIAALQAEMERALEALRTEKDAMIAGLQKEMQRLSATVASQSDEIGKAKKTQEQLLNAVNKSEDMALQAYSEDCIAWLKSGNKTVSIEEITRYSGLSKRKVEGAISKGLLQTAPRNRDLILVSSLTIWLKSVQPTPAKTDETPLLHIVNG